MFYSHEVLTSRKYGVATVWLVATLGSKSSLKRINRKQILDVDVAKACQTIVDPVVPMALRLQGNLLYGISRVYLQQCGYVLSDAQSAHNTMLMMLRTVKDLALDPDAGKARPEQLVLSDDPSFLPEFAPPPPDLLADLDIGFNVDIERSGESQSLTPLGSQHTQSSSQVGSIGGLVLPTSSPDAPGGFTFGSDNQLARPSGLLGADDGTQLNEPEFTFNEDGELVEIPSARTVAGTPSAHGRSAMKSDADASAKVRRDHEEGRMDGAHLPNDHMDLDLAIFGDELPEGEAFPTVGHDQGSNQFEVIHTSSTASAPMRKKRRVARVLPVDLRMELRNKDLVNWKVNYLQNMDAVLKSKKKARKAQQAKKDAEYFVWGSGIGGFAHHYANITGPNPFEMFIGDNLFELATGFSRKKVVGSKHDRDSGIDDATQNESRRVRQKIGESEEELARRVEDEGFSMPMEEVEVELPREAVSALDDQQVSSAMPWNISASKHGSSAIPRSGRFNMMDQGRPGNRPGSRLVSASPLLGHGLPLDLEALRYLESEGDVGMGGDEFALPGPSSPPTVIGPPQKTSTRVSAALSVECENFLEFVIEAIVEKRNNSQPGFHLMAAEAAAGLDEITVQELLPPANNSKIVACQGLMMVLTLGTKDMLDVQQAEDFGDISLKLTEKAKTSQVIEISDSEEDESEDESEGGVQIVEQERKDEDTFTGSAGIMQEDPEVEAGHFEEQFAAGHAAHEDNCDTLYNN